MTSKAPGSTGEFLEILKKEGELVEIDLPVSPDKVIPEIQRRTVAQSSKNTGPALFFSNVEGHRFPIATNLYGSTKRIELALGGDPQCHVRLLAQFMESLPPGWKSIKKTLPAMRRLLRTGLRKKSKAPVLQNSLTTLKEIPALTSWPLDGGPFVTLPLVYTQDPETGKGNLGMYRVQIQDERQVGMHIQIHRGGGNHFHKAESMNQPLPASVFIGGPPALTLAAVAPLPEDVPELAFTAFLMSRKLPWTPNPHFENHLIPSEADFCITGILPPHQRAPEGPFGDHYGYYSLQHPFPYMEVKSIYHRPNPVYPATVVGRPPQEDHFIAIFLQDLFKPLFPLVMKGVKDVFAYEESGVHSLATAIVKERYHKEAFTSCMRVLGEGQLSLTKVLLATEADLNPKDFRTVFTHILKRCDFRSDFHIFSNISLDTLDYTGPDLNKGSKALFLGLGDAQFDLCETAPKPETLPQGTGTPVMFCPGVLVLKGEPYSTNPQLPQNLVGNPAMSPYRMVILHDDPHDAARSDIDFIWNVFTRFEPAGDIHATRNVYRNHIQFEGPLIIDCRLKPGYPGVLEVDDETREKVDKIWDQLGLG